jgi:hypothetical protein
MTVVSGLLSVVSEKIFSLARAAHKLTKPLASIDHGDKKKMDKLANHTPGTRRLYEKCAGRHFGHGCGPVFPSCVAVCGFRTLSTFTQK